MNPFIASLTSAMLLAHAVVGCCWHHEHHVRQGHHDSAGRRRTESRILPVVCGEHRHSHHDAELGGPATPDNHRHDGDHGCDQRTCQYTARTIDYVRIVSWDGFFSPIVAADLPDSISYVYNSQQLTIGARTPVPLHLLHQSLVI